MSLFGRWQVRQRKTSYTLLSFLILRSILSIYTQSIVDGSNWGTRERNKTPRFNSAPCWMYVQEAIYSHQTYLQPRNDFPILTISRYSEHELGTLIQKVLVKRSITIDIELLHNCYFAKWSKIQKKVISFQTYTRSWPKGWEANCLNLIGTF